MTHSLAGLIALSVILHSAPAAAQAQQNPGSKTALGQAAQAKKGADAEAEFQKALDDAGNDRAALVHNLEDYLKRFPDSPHKVQIYRALVEAATQLRDSARALEYAERIIAVRPDDSSMMFTAIDLLKRAGDAHSLDKAIGYASRVLDLVEKAGADARSTHVSEAQWLATQKRVQMSLYLLRGSLQLDRRDYEAAAADLNSSYRLLPNPAAALHLGEIAEIRKDYKEAIDHYVTAFVLPDQQESSVDRLDVRRKLGNLWQLVNGSEAGLGERILQSYDRLNLETKSTGASGANGGASDPYAFVLRRLEGPVPVKLADWKGKVLVLSFWATWCEPCRELEPLFDRVGRKYESHPAVAFFSVNSDEDESRVAPYVAKEKLKTAVVFADGLDAFLEIRGLPTVVILDRSGRIAYRAEGFDEESFVPALTAAIERALGPAN